MLTLLLLVASSMKASKFGMLGSIDSNTGDPLLGWDTDQVRQAGRQ